MGLTDKHLAYGDDIPQTQSEKDYYWKINYQQSCDVSKLTQKAYEDGKKDGYVQAKAEQLNCDDCIRRREALNVVHKYFEHYLQLNDDICLDGLRSLPSVTPKEKTGWIPVSERLPEDIKPVIITWKNTDPKSYYQYIVGKHFIGTAHYKGGKWFWYSSVTEDLLAEYGKCDGEEFDEAIEVIAWMPLPGPYKAESEDKE